MGQREDAIALAKQKIVNEQDQALSDGLGDCYDQGLADQKAADGSGTSPADQSVIDGLNAQVASLNAQVAQDATDLAAAHADADAKLADMKSQLDAAIAADQVDKGMVEKFQSSLDSLQASLDAFKASIPAAPSQP